MKHTTSILLIYTGGTIGMKQDPVTSALSPFDFSQIMEEVPELKKFGYNLDSLSFSPVIDSSDVNIPFWIHLVEIIKDNYLNYDGFVILHGTDTMSYTASALSFMFENLEKPVILTGSQLPIGMLRTDGKENLISSIEIAASKREDGKPMVPEVCIYFESQLYRGNRTTKYNSENFRAFRSANSPVLAEVGIHIKFNTSIIRYPKIWGEELSISTKMDTNLVILKIIPGIQKNVIESITHISGLRAIIIETYGSGNAPTEKWFIQLLEEAVNRGIIIINITQCHAGGVDMDAYATGKSLKNIGIISGHDSTTEAAVAKLYYLMGQNIDNNHIKHLLEKNYRGEITKM